MYKVGTHATMQVELLEKSMQHIINLAAKISGPHLGITRCVVFHEFHNSWTNTASPNAKRSNQSSMKALNVDENIIGAHIL